MEWRDEGTADIADIFVSYAADDRDRVRPLVTALQGRGWTVWWDRDIPAGMSWDDVLEVELLGAKCVIVVWSRTSIESRWVKTEAMEALERECIVPIKLDDIAPPLAFRHVQTLDGSGSNLIDTIVRRVHALVGPAQRPAAQRSARASIAVLPFENLSRDPSHEYFSDGITEALITSLAQIRALKVISRTSVMRFKGQRQSLREIAAELGVERVIEGSVITAGSRVRITAQLIDAASDTHEWAQSFDRELADVLAIQDEIARLVVEHVRVQLTPRETERLSHSRRVDPLAHDCYLRGLSSCARLSAASMRDGIAHFEKSLATDPEFAPAHAALAHALHETKSWGNLRHLSASDIQPRQAAMAALLLDPTLAQAHLALATVEQDAWNWAATEREFKTTFALNSNFADAYRVYAEFLIIVGRPDEAVDAARRSVELEPLAARFHDDLGRTLYRACRFREALDEHKRAIELDPSFGPPYHRMTETLLELGEHDAIDRIVSGLGLPGPSIRGQLAALRGNAALARQTEQALAETESPWASIGRVEILTKLDDFSAAIDILEDAVDRRFLVPYMLRNPAINALKSEERFQRMMQRVGLAV